MARSMTTRISGWLLASVLLWAAVSDAWGYSRILLPALPDNWNEYIYGFVSRAVWSAPFLILLLHGRYQGAIQGRDVFSFHAGWLRATPILIIAFLYVIGAMLIVHGQWWLNPDVLMMQQLLKFAVVGVSEELVYRGFGLNMLASVVRAPKANIVSSLFFAAVHIPAYLIHWYRDGVLRMSSMMASIVTTFIAGLLFGAAFLKTRSLWPPAIIHFLYDLFFTMLVG